MSAPVRQPISVSMQILHNLHAAAECDDIAKSIDSGSLSKHVLVSQ
jgi:dihydroneopterin aldolase